MTNPSRYDHEAMINALDELLPALRLALAKIKSINHPDLTTAGLGIEDAISDAEWLKNQYEEKNNE